MVIDNDDDLSVTQNDAERGGGRTGLLVIDNDDDLSVTQNDAERGGGRTGLLVIDNDDDISVTQKDVEPNLKENKNQNYDDVGLEEEVEGADAYQTDDDDDDEGGKEEPTPGDEEWEEGQEDEAECVDEDEVQEKQNIDVDEEACMISDREDQLEDNDLKQEQEREEPLQRQAPLVAVVATTTALLSVSSYVDLTIEQHFSDQRHCYTCPTGLHAGKQWFGNIDSMRRLLRVNAINLHFDDIQEEEDLSSSQQRMGYHSVRSQYLLGSRKRRQINIDECNEYSHNEKTTERLLKQCHLTAISLPKIRDNAISKKNDTCKITNWQVTEGDQIKRGDILADVDCGSLKYVTSHVGGFLLSIVVEEREYGAAGIPLALIVSDAASFVHFQEYCRDLLRDEARFNATSSSAVVEESSLGSYAANGYSITG